MGFYDHNNVWHPGPEVLKIPDIPWSNSPDLTTGEDLRPGTPLYVHTETHELGWAIWSAGYPRVRLGMFVIRHDPHTGITYTKIEGKNG